jgi:hypothetical protein
MDDIHVVSCSINAYRTSYIMYLLRVCMSVEMYTETACTTCKQLPYKQWQTHLEQLRLSDILPHTFEIFWRSRCLAHPIFDLVVFQGDMVLSWPVRGSAWSGCNESNEQCATHRTHFPCTRCTTFGCGSFPSVYHTWSPKDNIHKA